MSSPRPRVRPGSPQTASARREAAGRAGVLVGLLACVLGAGVLTAPACLSPALDLTSGSQHVDAGGDASVVLPDSSTSALIGLFSVGGCSDLAFSESGPRCTGTAPLTVQLILLEVGATSQRWQLTSSAERPDGGVSDGGMSGDNILDEPSSRARAPSATLERPGTYQVALGVAGPGGTASATGIIVVQPAPIGAACARDLSCQAGLRCICGPGTGGRDGACPGGLAAGYCSQGCDGVNCPSGTVCMDLSRSLASMGPGSMDTWRHPTCAPTCDPTRPELGPSGGCRAGLSCRDVPTLPPGGREGGAYTWARACFTETPGAVGSSCLGGDEQPDGTACEVGLCEPLGARGVCSAACAPGSCPAAAACATWNSKVAPAPLAPRCLMRCDAAHPCLDPLLDCLPGGGTGSLGFKLLSDPMGTTVCAPRRCSTATDCKGGKCQAFGGASFCVR